MTHDFYWQVQFKLTMGNLLSKCMFDPEKMLRYEDTMDLTRRIGHSIDEAWKNGRKGRIKYSEANFAATFIKA